MDETPEIGRLLKISTHTGCSDIWAAVVRLGVGGVGVHANSPATGLTGGSEEDGFKEKAVFS